VGNNISVAGVCHIIACLQHNDQVGGGGGDDGGDDDFATIINISNETLRSQACISTTHSPLASTTLPGSSRASSSFLKKKCSRAGRTCSST
jgi:hypothetical protein